MPAGAWDIKACCSLKRLMLENNLSFPASHFRCCTEFLCGRPQVPLRGDYLHFLSIALRGATCISANSAVTGEVHTLVMGPAASLKAAFYFAGSALTSSAVTSETRYIHAARPDDEFKVMLPRQQ
eukprot:scaffold66858_cov17-Tisochrysis_lutea.AAC.1